MNIIETLKEKGYTMPLFDANYPYPLEDFLQDNIGIIESMKSNIYEMPKEIRIKDDKAKITSLTFDTSSPIYRMQEYFTNRYDIKAAFCRGWKYWMIIDYIGKWHDDLLNKQILIYEAGEAKVNTEFYRFLLDYRFKKIGGNYPKSLIKEFIKQNRNKNA